MDLDFVVKLLQYGVLSPKDLSIKTLLICSDFLEQRREEDYFLYSVLGDEITLRRSSAVE